MWCYRTIFLNYSNPAFQSVLFPPSSSFDRRVARVTEVIVATRVVGATVEVMVTTITAGVAGCQWVLPLFLQLGSVKSTSAVAP